MNADGTALRNLTSTPSLWETDVDWQAIPGPRRGDFMNAAQFCKAEQAFWGDQFSQRYRNFGAVREPAPMRHRTHRLLGFVFALAR